MASSPKTVAHRTLPAILSNDERAQLADSFAIEPLSSADLDPAYAAVLRSLTREQLQHVKDSQAEHLNYLLAPELDEAAWQQAARALGRDRARYAIPLDWTAECYRLYARHVNEHILSLPLPASEQARFGSEFVERLFHDLSMHAAGHAEELDAENRLRETPTQLDHLLLTVPSVAVLYPQLTDFLAKIPGVDAAWLGHPDEAGIVHPHAAAGSGIHEYLDGYPIFLLDNPDSPLARAWLTNQTQFVADLNDPRTGRLTPYWEQRRLRFGWRSCCAIPVTGTDGQRDALMLYSKRLNFFEINEVRHLIAHLQAVLGITLERLRLVEALKEQQQTLILYKTGMDASRNGILISDAVEPDLPIRYVNPEFERITGYSTEEALGRHLLFLANGDTDQPELQIVRDALNKEEPCAVEVRNHRKDGTMFWNSLSMAPVRNEAGAVTHFIGVQNDITRLKNAADENGRANALYRALMSAAELVIRAQDEGQLLDELCRLLVESGLFAQAWIGRPNIAGDLEVQSVFSILNLKEYWYLPNVYTGDENRVLSVRAWRQSKLQYTNDRLGDPAHPAIHDFYQEHGLRATAVVPLYRDGDLWALLTLHSPQSNLFNPELLELLERIARLAGHGLDALDLRQILEQERLHQSWLARHDALTDILNRRGIIERMEEALSRARRHKTSLAIAVMDLDGFKIVNDLHGHSTGDLLLRTIADRLQSTLRQTDAMGRLGSDEFVLILEDIEDQDGLTTMLSRVQASVEGPIQLSNERVVTVRGCVGVTLFPQDDSPPERLLRHADRALYALKESKEEPDQRWMVFQAEVDAQKFVREKTILSLFRSGNIRVHYQPVIDLQTGKVSGIEALARLADNDSSLLPPGEFLPHLSSADLVTLTHQVLAQSARDLHRLDKAGFELSVGINLEPIMLADPKAMEDLRHQMQTSGIAPHRIILELLERADTLSLAGSQQALRDLKLCGAQVALDDVGSAYSSLLRVKELPVDLIKLDRSFLIGLERQPKELRFLMNLVHLAQALGLGFVAEGIECSEAGDALAALGVRLAQGYSIARPMGIEDLLKWLKRYKPVPWTRPTSVLGAVALQLRNLDATGRILEQRPSFLRYLLARDSDWEREIGTGLREATGPGASKLASAHQVWHRTLTTLSAQSDGTVAFQSFEFARSAYEEAMFQAALEAAPPLN